MRWDSCQFWHILVADHHGTSFPSVRRQTLQHFNVLILQRVDTTNRCVLAGHRAPGMSIARSVAGAELVSVPAETGVADEPAACVRVRATARMERLDADGSTSTDLARTATVLRHSDLVASITAR